MFATYLRRELSNRRRQTMIIAIGMALAIGLVIIVNAVSAGVRTAQEDVLASVYGIGTDITISQQAEPGTGGGGGFAFGADSGATDATGATSQNQLRLARGTASFDASMIDDITASTSVQAATGTLALSNMSFSGTAPQSTDGGGGGGGGGGFNVDSFTVDGISVDTTAVGPMSTVELVDGRMFDAADAGTNVVLLDSTYASSSALAVGDTVTIGTGTFEVIGTVASASADATTAADTYIPLDVAQTLAGLDGQVSSVYVQATSSSEIAALQTQLEASYPDASVNTQADLASSVSGSLGTASDLVSNLGTWLSVIVLAAAFMIAILFTISGVGRRTREFGTLKSIGWSNRRIVAQVSGESLVQGVIGGALGIAIGLVGILLVNLAAPTLSASATTQAAPAGGAGFGGGGGMGAAATAATTDVSLSAAVDPSMLLLAVGLAVLGGLVAGAIGGWRAARLRPAESLRSVA